MKHLLTEILLGLIAVFAVNNIHAAPIAIPDWVMGAQVKQHAGIVYVRVTVAGVTGCFTNITSKIDALPDQWQTITSLYDATLKPTVTDNQVCTDTLPATAWVVAPNPQATDTPPTRPLKDGSGKNAWRITVGTPCENDSGAAYRAGQEWHYATNGAGNHGLTICEKK